MNAPQKTENAGAGGGGGSRSGPTRRTSTSSLASISSAASTASAASLTNGGCFAKTFPEKLMDMLETSSDASGPHHNVSVSWLPHGRSFSISDPDKFTAEVLPRYFRRSKFKSFTRKLYRWGFRQITKGGDAGSYYHELFRRDEPELTGRMNCHYSEKELRTQQENAAAATRRRSSGALMQAARRASGRSSFRTSRRALGSVSELQQQQNQQHGGIGRRPSVDEDDEEAVMAQIKAVAALMGGSRGEVLGGNNSHCDSPQLGSNGHRHQRHSIGVGALSDHVHRLSTFSLASAHSSHSSLAGGMSLEDSFHNSNSNTLDGFSLRHTSPQDAPSPVAALTQQTPRVGASLVPCSVSLALASGEVAEAEAEAEGVCGGSPSFNTGVQGPNMPQVPPGHPGPSTPSPSIARDTEAAAVAILERHRAEDAILAQKEAELRRKRELLQQSLALTPVTSLSGDKNAQWQPLTSPAIGAAAPPAGLDTLTNGDNLRARAEAFRLEALRAAQSAEQEARLLALERLAEAGGGGWNLGVKGNGW